MRTMNEAEKSAHRTATVSEAERLPAIIRSGRQPTAEDIVPIADSGQKRGNSNQREFEVQR